MSTSKPTLMQLQSVLTVQFTADGFEVTRIYERVEPCTELPTVGTRVRYLGCTGRVLEHQLELTDTGVFTLCAVARLTSHTRTAAMGAKLCEHLTVNGWTRL